jgi:hypothetical protein
MDIEEAYSHWKKIDERVKRCDQRINVHVKDAAPARAAKSAQPP